MTKAEFKQLSDQVRRMSHEELIRFVSDLRTKADLAEAAFLMALVAIEKTETWKKVCLLGEETFLDWLDKNNICKPARYANFRQATDVLDYRVMNTIGVHASIRLAAIDDAEKRDAVQLLMLETVRESRRPLSAQTATRKVEQICGSRPRAFTRMTLVDELKSQLRAAKSKIAELEAENERLRAETLAPEQSQAVSQRKKRTRGHRSQSAA